MSKLKVGFYSFTSCQGCELTLLNSEEFFAQVIDMIDIVRFPIIQEYCKEGPFDVIFAEGAIANKYQIAELEEIRKKTKYLISFGTCATFGGISAVRNFKPKLKSSREYQSFQFLENVEACGLDKHVKVDYKIRGCPPCKEEFLEVLKSIKAGKLIVEYDKSVCVECRAKGNKCLLAQGIDCLGPVSCGGCDALCTTKGIKCYGCRGPVSKPNVDSLVNLFEKKGLSHKQILDRFMLFAGTSKRYKKLQRGDDL